jgi:hypothetical protein
LKTIEKAAVNLYSPLSAGGLPPQTNQGWGFLNGFGKQGTLLAGVHQSYGRLISMASG